MGQLCGISHAEVSRLAKGKKPSIKTINNISKGLDIPKTRLLKLAGHLEEENKKQENGDVKE
ncbi:hypothetical protein MWH28_05235 [Natroniella sulfidigena]|nr:hypothetical protein [Natroniella sulfidigena]